MDIIIGQKGTYDSFLDFVTPLVYLPKMDAVLITRHFIMWKTSYAVIENNIAVALCHESIHETICKLMGEKESRAFDNVPYFNSEIEKWLGLHY